MAKFYVSKKDLSWNKAEKSGFMGSLMKHQDVSGVLDSSAKRNEFYSAVRKAASGGALDRKKLSQAFGNLSQKSKYFSRKTIDRISRAALPGYKYNERYSFSNDSPPNTSSAQQRPVYGGLPSSARPRPMAAAQPINQIRLKGTAGLSGKIGIASVKTGLPGMRE